jgi:hypothetical protein
MRLLCTLAALAAAAAPLAAQKGNAVLSGRVLADSVRTPVVNAAVAIPALNRSASTDEQGRFQIADIKPGSHEIVVRRLGYSPYHERIAFAANQAVEHEILLVRATVLDSITVSASAVIPSFEENRAVGLGRFITRAELAKQETRRLSEVVAQISGVRVIAGMRNNAWLSSKRAAITSISNRGGKSCLLDEVDAMNGAKACECYAHVYLDKQPMYRGSALGREPLFSLNSVNVDQIEAIEYYAGPAQTPLEYSRLNSQCGVLVIHTRRSP